MQEEDTIQRSDLIDDEAREAGDCTSENSSYSDIPEDILPIFGITSKPRRTRVEENSEATRKSIKKSKSRPAKTIEKAKKRTSKHRTLSISTDITRTEENVEVPSGNYGAPSTEFHFDNPVEEDGIQILDLQADLHLNRLASDKEKKERKKTIKKVRYHCDTCSREFPLLTQLEQHLKGKSHKKVLESKTGLFCKLCKCNFKTEDDKKLHYKGKQHKRNLKKQTTD